MIPLGVGGRRYMLRLDGFISINAPLAGGELITPPLIFAGKQSMADTPRPRR